MEENNKKEVVYNAYTEEDKKRYKELRDKIDTTKKYETYIKNEKQTALLTALIAIIITILIITDVLGSFFTMFYFTGFYGVAIINAFLLIHSFKSLKETKLYIPSIIFTTINIILSFMIMFSL